VRSEKATSRKSDIFIVDDKVLHPTKETAVLPHPGLSDERRRSSIFSYDYYEHYADDYRGYGKY
jgi:hypothetical protein